MRRFGVLLATAIALWVVPAASAAPYTASEAVKINVMGEWAHPDDDTSIIGPCGVWHQKYDTKCGIIMVTRGEGGGNATGTELGPDLGLRRENEDRVAHYRSGTIDIFNIDSVDFFYNQTAPLTQFFWGTETLRRITRIIRMTQPDVYIGFTPSLAAGHGNHQMAGRYIWEGMKAAADPAMFPEQLTGPNALSTWQVKKVFSGGATAGTGGTTTAADCTTGFTPTGLDNVAGVWTGYASPYLWPAGNLQGQPAGTAKTWAQVASEGASAYPTQSRVMYKAVAANGCSRFGMTGNFVPFQPNVNPDGSANAAAGKDDAILYGAVKPDPGGLPLGTLQYLTFSDFYNTPGGPFDATVHLKAGAGTIPAGNVALTVPTGWTVSAPKAVGSVTSASETTVTFTVTPSATAAVNTNFKVAAVWTAGAAKGYTDQVVRVVSPVEGLFQRWGKFAEYDQWTEQTAPAARRLGRSGAQQTTAVGETITIPVKVHNWSDDPQSGTVSLTLPPGVTADATSKPYPTLAPGAETTVNFAVSNSFTNATLPYTNPGNPPGQQVNTNVNVRITTTYNGGSGFEDLALAIVPKTAIPSGSAPTLDGAEGAGEYTGESLDVGKKWEPGGATRDCIPLGVDCGSAGANQTYAKVTRSGDDLYFFIRVQDDFQSYAVTPQECVGHWQADSVEIIIDPRGRASDNAMDTASTFKLGVFPFTNDPTNANGNGVNGPCWSRDADNHQGFSTGPLAATVEGGPNAAGVQVKSSATWVGTNDTTTSHAYAGGGYNLEVKIPMSLLPAAVDPARMGLNITPYDNDDNTAGTGSTVLRHTDQSTRLAWSTFGSVQSDPYRWGRATLPGYTPPADRPTTPAAPKLAKPLDSANSPQTIAQSARNGVPISGRDPAPEARGLKINGATVSGTTVSLNVTAGAAGTARLFLYDVNPIDGNKSYTRVWNTSCSPLTDPAPDYGLSACNAADGSTPAWAPDMMGGIKASRTVAVTAGTSSITLTGATAAQLASGASLLVSFVNAADEVQAFDVPIKATSGDGTVGGTVPATLSLSLGAPASFGPFTPGLLKTYFASTPATVTSTAGDALLSVSDPSSVGTGHLVNGSFVLPEPLQARARNATNTGTAYNNVGSNLNLLTWNGPVSNDAVNLEFSQLVKANDPLRTGTYAKTLTFTLSTTNP